MYRYIGCIRVTNNDILPMPRFPYVLSPPVREGAETHTLHEGRVSSDSDSQRH